MKYFKVVLFLIISHVVWASESEIQLNSENISAVKAWWLQCEGDKPTSSCLTDSELAKFKNLCSDKANKKDCKTVVNFSVALTRVPEGRYLLTQGFLAQTSNLKKWGQYQNDVEKIWSADDKSDNANSFAVGVLPSCNSKKESQLYFSSNLRPAVKKVKNEIAKVYHRLATIPCADPKVGFTLVAIGKVHDNSDEFEIYTMDEKKNLKQIHSALGADPFQPNATADRLISQVPNK